MSETIVGITGIFVLLLLFATGIELGFAMGLVGFVGFAYLNGFHSAINLLSRDVYDVVTNYGYTVFPLFVLMGQIGFNAGIAVRLYDAAHKFIGHVPGGLAMATVMGATGFKTICGSSAATAATFASVAIPQMERYGYDKKLSTGVVATVGSLGCIIPPSVVLIILGILTEQSIGQLFLAGVIPGLIIAVFFMGIIYGWAKINPAIAPRSEASTWGARMRYPPGGVLDPGCLSPGCRRDHAGLFHPHGGRGGRHLCRSPSGDRKAGHDLQDLRQVSERGPPHRHHDSHARRRLHRAGPFYHGDQHPAEYGRRGSQGSPSTAT